MRSTIKVGDDIPATKSFGQFKMRRGACKGALVVGVLTAIAPDPRGFLLVVDGACAAQREEQSVIELDWQHRIREISRW